MDMLRTESMTELDLLNKHIRDFLGVYEWLQEKKEADSVLDDYVGTRLIMKDSLPYITKEIYSCGELPSESDRDRQDFEQLVIFLRSLVSEKQEEVVADHLDEVLLKVKRQLKVLDKKDYAADTRVVLTALEAELRDLPDPEDANK